jgi:nucleotide-binding universal stress UspA family protein
VIAEATRQLESVFMGILYKAEEKVRQEKPKLKVSTKLEHGRPEEKIGEMAKSGYINLIVMGARA